MGCIYVKTIKVELEEEETNFYRKQSLSSFYNKSISVIDSLKESNTVSIKTDYDLNKNEIYKGFLYHSKNALHKHTGITVNTKIFQMKTLQKLINDEHLKYFNSLNLLKSLDNEYIERIFEVFTDKDDFYIISEKFQGNQLFQVLKPNTSLYEISLIMNQLFLGLDYFHERKIVYRNLHHKNILYNNDEETPFIKLINLLLISDRNKKSFNNSISGNIEYMAPEILNKGKYNELIDMWACGVLLYVIIMGKYPFKGNNDIETLNLIKKGEFTLKNIPICFEELINGLLNYDPNKRFTAKEAIKKNNSITKESLSNYYIGNINDIYKESKLEKLKIMMFCNVFLNETEKGEIFADFLFLNERNIFRKNKIWGKMFSENEEFKQNDEIILIMSCNYNNYIKYFISGQTIIGKKLEEIFEKIENTNTKKIQLKDLFTLAFGIGRDEELIDKFLMNELNALELELNFDGFNLFSNKLLVF